MKTGVANRREHWVRVAVLLCGCLAVCACAQTKPAASAAPAPAPAAETEGTGLLALGTPGVRTPIAPGERTYTENGVTVDSSCAELGYVMVKSEANARRLKVRVGLEGNLYNYDLPSDGAYHTFVLPLGDGAYIVRVLEQVEGERYSPICQTGVDVALVNAYEPFLYPNAYVRFDQDSAAASEAGALVDGLSTAREKAAALYAFVSKTVAYDDDKAATVEAGYVPSADETLRSRRGICFDYAVLLAVMLRTQGIPAKVVVGRVEPDGLLHAWNSVLLDDAWTLFDPTFGEQQKLPESSYAEERVY